MLLTGRQRKILVFMVISIVMLGLLIAGCGSIGGNDGPDKGNEREAFNIGRTVKIDNLGVGVTINGVRTSDGEDFDQFSGPEEGNRFLIVDVTVENLGNQAEYFAPEVQLKLYDGEGIIYKQVLTDKKGELGGQIGSGEKMRKEIAWEVPIEATGLRMVFDSDVLVRKIGEELVNGPITVVAQRRGSGQVRFAIGDVSEL